MRGKISKHWNIIAATLFSVVLVVGAYVLAHGIESPQVAQASTETALLKAIATKDSNGDGLPDWQKTLYGIPTTSTTTDYFNLGMTDGEAVAKGLIVPKAIADIRVATSSVAFFDENGLPPPPADGTLTAAFAQSFFTLFLAARQANDGADLSESQINDVASQAIQSLSSITALAPDYKSASDLSISSESGHDALAAFATDAENILMRNTTNATSSEFVYLNNVLQNGDTTALSHIASIAKGYREVAIGLAALPVPAELAKVDLLFINAMMRLSEITSDFARVNDDPLATILALEQYPQAVQALGTALIEINSIYKTAGVIIPVGRGTAAEAFVRLLNNSSDTQSATNTP